MSFDWSMYLHLARELAGCTSPPSTEEAKLRSAISRAYFAAFCHARNHLRDREGLPVPAGVDVHRYVRDRFRSSPEPLRKAIGENLNRLRKARNRVDYDDAVQNLSAQTHIVLGRAEQVIATLSRL